MNPSCNGTGNVSVDPADAMVHTWQTDAFMSEVSPRNPIDKIPKGHGVPVEDDLPGDPTGLSAPSTFGIIRDTNCIGANSGYVHVPPREQVAQCQRPSWPFNNDEVKRCDASSTSATRETTTTTTSTTQNDSPEDNRLTVARQYFLNTLYDFLNIDQSGMGLFTPSMTLAEVIRTIVTSEHKHAQDIVVQGPAEIEFLQHKLADALRIPYARVRAEFMDLSRPPMETLKSLVTRADEMNARREQVRELARKKCECPSQFARLAMEARQHAEFADQNSSAYQEVCPGTIPLDDPSGPNRKVWPRAEYDTYVDRDSCGFTAEKPRMVCPDDDLCRPMMEPLSDPRVTIDSRSDPRVTIDSRSDPRVTMDSFSELLKHGANAASGFARCAADAWKFRIPATVRAPNVTLNDFAKQITSALQVLPFPPKEAKFSMTLKA